MSSCASFASVQPFEEPKHLWLECGRIQGQTRPPQPFLGLSGNVRRLVGPLVRGPRFVMMVFHFAASTLLSGPLHHRLARVYRRAQWFVRSLQQARRHTPSSRSWPARCRTMIQFFCSPRVIRQMNGMLVATARDRDQTVEYPPLHSWPRRLAMSHRKTGHRLAPSSCAHHGPLPPAMSRRYHRR